MQSIRVLLVDKSKVKTKHTQSQVPSQSKVVQFTLRCWAKTQYISLSKTLLFCTDDTTEPSWKFVLRNGFEFHSKCGSTFSIVYYLFNHVLFSPCFFQEYYSVRLPVLIRMSQCQLCTFLFNFLLNERILRFDSIVNKFFYKRTLPFVGKSFTKDPKTKFYLFSNKFTTELNELIRCFVVCFCNQQRKIPPIKCVLK